MKTTTLLAVSAAALSIGLAMPASAQQTSTNTATNGSTATTVDLQAQDILNNKSVNTAVDSFNDNSDNSDNSNNSINDSFKLALGSYNTDNSDNSDNSTNTLASYNAIGSYNSDDSINDSYNDNSYVAATQILVASVSNAATLNFDGALSNYSSGDNQVQGNAFAAYAGILNQAWNTGINANAQAATNISARGTVTFGP